jgi:hypothetical protein
MNNLRLTRPWIHAHRRLSIIVGSVLGAALVLVLFIHSVTSAIGDARSEVALLVHDASSTTFDSLLEPTFYFQSSAQSRASGEALDDVKSRVGPVWLIGSIPWLGGYVARSKSTIAVGVDLSYAAADLLEIYGQVLQRRNSDGFAASIAYLAENSELIAATSDRLRRAHVALDRELVLNERESAAVVIGIGAMQALATLADKAPSAIDDMYTLISVMQDLRTKIDDPFVALEDSDAIEQQVARLNVAVASASVKVEPLTLVGDSGPYVALIGTGLQALAAGGKAAGALVEGANAMDEGIFSVDFGVALAAQLAAAIDSLGEAERLLGEFRDQAVAISSEQELGDELDRGAEAVLAPAYEMFQRTSDAVDSISSLLGFASPRTYLVVLQNQDEIRATGGFIGATLEMTLEEGVLGDLIFQDSRAIDSSILADNPLAPEPVYWYLWIARLLFRDANWSPDFPTSALALRDQYQATQNVPLDGVFAVTKLLAYDMVDAVGGVNVSNAPGIVNGARAQAYSNGEFDYLCEDRHVSYTVQTHDKRCFDEDLVPALMNAMRGDLTGIQSNAIIEVFKEHLGRKDMLLYAEDPVVQNLLVEKGWAGQVPIAAQDFLMVVDSSLPGHTSSSIRRTWDYTVDLSPRGDSRAKLRIHFDNRNTRGAQVCRQAAEGGGGCHWNYLRILLPPKAKDIIAPSSALHVGSEKLIWGYVDLETTLVNKLGAGRLDGMVEVGSYVVVEPNTIQTAAVDYTLDSGIIRNLGAGRHEYRLQLVKQPGISSDIISVHVSLPAGATVTTTWPSSFKASADGVDWHEQLLTDQELVVVFQVNET